MQLANKHLQPIELLASTSNAAVIVGIILVVAAFSVLYLVLFSSLETQIRTLFSDSTQEPLDDSNGQADDSPSSNRIIDVLAGVIGIVAGALLVQTGMAGHWLVGNYPQEYGPSVRAAGAVSILMGTLLLFPKVLLWLLRSFRRPK